MMLNITEAANSLGCHPDTLRRIERGGQFQARRDRRGARRYSPQDIDRLRDVLYRPVIGQTTGVPATIRQ